METSTDTAARFRVMRLGAEVLMTRPQIEAALVAGYLTGDDEVVIDGGAGRGRVRHLEITSPVPATAWVVAWVLGGMLGAHAFVSGRTGAGWLRLALAVLSFGIFALPLVIADAYAFAAGRWRDGTGRLVLRR